jgi:3-deoxy-manno-octulosonate cytidylyltransferase (CMP-KDO synthetase)
MRVLIVIPSRFGSTRFPGKSLAAIAGKPMIQWVWEAAQRCRRADGVIVATDDPRIFTAVERFGGQAAMTKAAHRSGTDRVAEVAERHPAAVYVNLQGDEPLVAPAAVDALIEGLIAAKAPMATLAHRIETEEEWRRPEVVKVVTNTEGDALYFSRSPIPFQRTFDPRTRLWRHVGIYAFRAASLRQFVKWRPSPLEKAESLEQLRALENGLRLRVLATRFRSAGVDTPGDLKEVEARLAKRRKS